jgi:hypothetical protein
MDGRAVDLRGLLVAIFLAGGNIHGGNLLVITFVSSCSYAVLFLLVSLSSGAIQAN